MTIRTWLFITVCITFTFHAFATSLSATTNGVYLIVDEWPGELSPVSNTIPIHYDHRLDWRACCDTGNVSLIYPADTAYGPIIKMWGVDGKEVPKTDIGKNFGSKWTQLHSYKDARMASIDAQGKYNEYYGPQGLSGRLLPAPKDLFRMETNGIYTMEIQMQMFRGNGLGVDPVSWKTNLFCFSPIKIKVEKPGINKEEKHGETNSTAHP